MNQYITNIVTYGISLIVKALTFIPKITAEEFSSAIDLAITQLTNAKSTFTAASTEDLQTKVESMVGDALEVAQNSCDAAGDTQVDAYFTVAEEIDNQLLTGKMTILTAIIDWFKAKKAAKQAAKG